MQAKEVKRPLAPGVQLHQLALQLSQLLRRQLTRLPELKQLCSVSGEFDYLAQLRAESTARLDALLDHIGEIKGVVRTHTSMVLAVKVDRL